MSLKKRIVIALAMVTRVGPPGGGLSLMSNEASAGRGGVLDDGKELLPQAGITLAEAIAAAQTAASGPLDEVDLERWQGRLVFNVDVGDSDVKVDAATGEVLAADEDDQAPASGAPRQPELLFQDAH